jgi:tRNA (guanosine-2'-O-)-methyltransferase
MQCVLTIIINFRPGRFERKGHKVEKSKMKMHELLKRTSVSASLWVFTKAFATTAECMNHLEKNNYKSLVTSPHVKGAENYSLPTIDFTPFKKLAIWFGNETKGISVEAVEKSNGCIQIPMGGIIESFNLACCTAIVLSFAAQQRRAFTDAKRNLRFLKPPSVPLTSVPLTSVPLTSVPLSAGVTSD